MHFAFYEGFVISNRCTKVALFHILLDSSRRVIFNSTFPKHKKGVSRKTSRAEVDGLKKISHLQMSFEKLLSLESIYIHVSVRLEMSYLNFDNFS